MNTRGHLALPVMRRQGDPERERRTGESTWNDAICTLGNGGQAEAWLAVLCRELKLPAPSRQLLLFPQPAPGADLAVLCRSCGIQRAVVTLDCPEGRALAADRRVETVTFSEGKDTADLTARDLRLRGERLHFVAVTRQELTRVAVPVEELYPALAVLTAADWLGAPLEQAGRVLTACAAEERPLENME